jgi:hypothetical protein
MPCAVLKSSLISQCDRPDLPLALGGWQVDHPSLLANHALQGDEVIFLQAAFLLMEKAW